MFQCLTEGRVLPDENNMTLADLKVFSSVIEQNLEEIGKRLQTLNGDKIEPNQEPQMETSVFQPQLKTASYQRHLQMAVVSAEHGLDMDANPMQRLLFMDLLNGERDETIMPPFGDPNLQFWPNLGLLP